MNKNLPLAHHRRHTRLIHRRQMEYSARSLDRAHFRHPLLPRQRQGRAQLPSALARLCHSHHHLVERRDFLCKHPSCRRSRLLFR